VATGLIGLPTGLGSRAATIGDVDAMTELIAACELDADGVAEIGREDLVVDFGRSGFEPALDTVLVFDGDVLVACAEVWRGRAEADVHPTHRGRGIGTSMLAWAEGRARELGSPTIGQTVTDANAAAIELFGLNGYAPKFTSWILEIRLDEGPPPEPVLPEGIRVRTFEPDRDEKEVFRLIDNAFDEWPDRDEPWSYEDWRTLVIDHPSFAAEASPLALDGDEIVGAALSFDVPGEGWVQQLATKATHRHRGIARVLLQHAFGGFHSRGKTLCGLNTDSRMGALGLYEKVGMSVRRSYTRYSKQL
jgi:ribosomal protein S18 acetylase RimI-like enzyme